MTSVLQSLEGKSEDDLKSQNIQLHRQANERARKIEQLKTLITGQHEIIENYKNAATSFEAEREAHAAETKRLEVNVLIFKSYLVHRNSFIIFFFLSATSQRS